MKNYNKVFKQEFKDVAPTEEQSNRMLNNILNGKSHKNMYLKLSVAISSIVILCFFGITNANDIKKTFNSLIINYQETRDDDGNKYIELVTSYDGVLEINYDANLPEISSWVDAFEKGGITYFSNHDWELLLGVKLLKNKIFVQGYNINVLRKNLDNKISYAKLYESYDLYSEEHTTDENKLIEHLGLSLQFKTKYYEEENDFNISIREYYDSKNYYIENLDTTALVVRLDERARHYLVIFSHNNIRYSFYYDNYASEVSEEESLKRVHEILDSFEY